MTKETQIGVMQSQAKGHQGSWATQTRKEEDWRQNVTDPSGCEMLGPPWEGRAAGGGGSLTLGALFLFSSNSPLLSASSALEHPSPDSCLLVSVPPPPRSPPAPGPADAPAVPVLTLWVLPVTRLV